MQKLLLLLLLAAGTAQAQNPFVAPEPPGRMLALLPGPKRPAGWQAGMLVGYDLFRVTNPRPGFVVGPYRVVPRMTTPAPGFRVGAWVRRGFGRRWLVQPELAYSRSQSWHRVQSTDRPDQALSTGQDWQRLNLSLPVGYRLKEHWLLLSGPVLARRIPTGYERLDPGSDPDQRIVGSINHSMRRNGLAWQAGVGYETGRLRLTVRYERSLLDVARTIELEGQQYSFRHYATQLSFGAAVRIAPLP